MSNTPGNRHQSETKHNKSNYILLAIKCFFWEKASVLLKLLIGLCYLRKMPKIALGTTAIRFDLSIYSICVVCTCALKHNCRINFPGPLSTTVAAHMVKIQTLLL